MARKIIVNLAMSLDGYIASENGGYDWVTGDGNSTHDTKSQFSFDAFFANIDTVVMGTNAYNDCDLSTYKDKKIIVATSKKRAGKGNVSFSSKVCDDIVALQKEEGKDIWLFGGGVLVDEFIKRNIIDYYIVGIIPTILGKGRKMFYADNPTIRLVLEKCSVNDGITILEYVKGDL